MERGALSLAVGLMKCPENTVMADSCTVVALIAANKDEWKDAAREAGCIPQVSRLVCSKNMQVRLEAAAAVRARRPASASARSCARASATIRSVGRPNSPPSACQTAATLPQHTPAHLGS